MKHTHTHTHPHPPTHTHTHTHTHTSQRGSSLGERTGCGGVCSACSLHPSLPLQTGLQESVPGAWGAETITCLHGGSALAPELVSRLPACVPPQRFPVVCWLTGPPVHICPLTLCSSLISCSCLHRRTGFVKTLLCLSLACSSSCKNESSSHQQTMRRVH